MDGLPVEMGLYRVVDRLRVGHRGHMTRSPDFHQLMVEQSRMEQIDHPTPIQGKWKIDGIGLPREVLEKIYYKNAARLLDLEI